MAFAGGYIGRVQASNSGAGRTGAAAACELARRRTGRVALPGAGNASAAMQNGVARRRIMSQETKERIRSAALARAARRRDAGLPMVSLETRRKISLARTGAVVSTETKQKMSNAAKRTWQLRKVLVATGRADKQNDGENTATSTESSLILKNKRRPMSEETKEKIRTAMTGRRLSTERRKKISSAMKGRKLAPEHRALIKTRRLESSSRPRKMSFEATKSETSSTLPPSCRTIDVQQTHEDFADHDTLMDSITLKMNAHGISEPRRAAQQAVDSAMQSNTFESKSKRCVSCNGQGMVRCACGPSCGGLSPNAACQRCVGSGILFCKACDGSGLPTGGFR